MNAKFVADGERLTTELEGFGRGDDGESADRSHVDVGGRRWRISMVEIGTRLGFFGFLDSNGFGSNWWIFERIGKGEVRGLVRDGKAV